MHIVAPAASSLPENADASHAGPARTMPARVAVAGATGYAGQELMRLLARHPNVVIAKAMSSGASGPPRPLPALARLWDGAVEPLAPEAIARDAEIAFLALPDAAAAELAPSLLDAGVRIIDLSGAFRLRSAADRIRWYPETRRVPDGVAYGLTELEHEAVAGARLVANPGCYPTAALLALAPLVTEGLLVAASDIVIDAKSGVSGAGKTPTERTHFSECHGSVSAYGVFAHRHTAEIEQGVAHAVRHEAPPAAHTVTFVPHLVPLDRGLLATIYARVRPGTTEEMLADAYRRAYARSTFVRLVGSSLPEIKHVAHSNFCDLGWRVDGTGRAVLVSAIDNLGKGAAGQAVQNLNVLLGIDERTALL